MTELKATKGPWVVHTNTAWPFDMSIVSADHQEVFYIRRVAHTSSQKTLADVRSAKGFDQADREMIVTKLAEQEADVALAAAAPELYEALADMDAILTEGIMNCDGGRLIDAMQANRTALAKARGETQ